MNSPTTGAHSREMVCISCPLGCRLTVSWQDREGDVRVEGNRCAKGESYAVEELRAPRRVLTATVKVRTSRGAERLPVKTSGPLPREHILGLLETMYAWELQAPVALGQVLLPDIEGSGVDLVAAWSLEA